MKELDEVVEEAAKETMRRFSTQDIDKSIKEAVNNSVRESIRRKTEKLVEDYMKKHHVRFEKIMAAKINDRNVEKAIADNITRNLTSYVDSKLNDIF